MTDLTPIPSPFKVKGFCYSPQETRVPGRQVYRNELYIDEEGQRGLQISSDIPEPCQALVWEQQSRKKVGINLLSSLFH
eukprot:1160584-Pelagomonas_calceolata.AAC.1